MTLGAVTLMLDIDAGPGIKAGCQINKPVPITTVAATGLEYLGLEASTGAEKSVWELIT